MCRYDVRDFTKPVSSKGVSIYEINITPQEMEMFIDLQPFVNPTPYIVPEDMSLTKVRFLSLFHLYFSADISEINQHSTYLCTSFPNVGECLVDVVDR